MFLGLLLAFGIAGAEEVKVTTYYPSPEGEYNKLNTTGNTNLATTSAGNVGIGTPTPGWKLGVNGSMHTSSPSWTGSDGRFKREVAPLRGALAMVERLQGVSFEWRVEDVPQRGLEKGRQIGLIAQDVEKVVPELVRTDNSPEGCQSVSYEKAVPILIEATKEQQQQFDLLKKEIAELQKR